MEVLIFLYTEKLKQLTQGQAKLYKLFQMLPT